jgi:hypothetical protein
VDFDFGALPDFPDFDDPERLRVDPDPDRLLSEREPPETLPPRDEPPPNFANVPPPHRLSVLQEPLPVRVDFVPNRFVGTLLPDTVLPDDDRYVVFFE